MQDDNRWRAERRMMIACAMVTGALPTSAAAQSTQGGVDALPAITVEERPEVYREPVTTLGGKFEAELMRIPQGVQVVNDKVIRDQGAVDIGDVLRNIPSANVGNTRLAPFASFSWTLRGFDAGVNRNGFRQLYFEDVDQSALWNIERIDVIKGPSSSLFGQEGLGGTINLVTKMPHRQFAAEVRGAYGEDDYAVGQFDVTGPLAAGGALSGRITGEIERSGSFVDFQDIDRSNIAMSALWDDGGKARYFVNLEYYERRSLSYPGLPVTGTIIGNGVAQVAREAYLGEPGGDYLDTSSPILQAWAEFDLTPQWTLSPRFQYYHFNVHQQQMRLRAADPLDPTVITRTGRFDFHENDHEYTVQLELRGKVETGPLRHQLLIGGQVAEFDDEGDWFDFDAPPSIDALNPTYQTGPLAVDPFKITFSNLVKNRELYLQDLISVTSKLDIMGGVRGTSIEADSEFLGDVVSHESDHVGYNIGATYRLLSPLSLFAGYATSLDIENVLGSISRDGTPFEPEESAQVEAGVKWELVSGLSGTASFFHITRENVGTTDPVDPDFTIQVGEQRVQGAEIELAWDIDDNWHIQGGYAYLDGEITESNDGDQGNRIEDVAEHQVNFWGRYLFTSGPLSGLSLGVGANYVGERAGDNANSFDLPAYTTVDLRAAYTWHNLTAEIVASNLLDEEYYTQNNSTAVYAGDPRMVFGRIGVRF
jgi:iron complex outermembrane receptor protein